MKKNNSPIRLIVIAMAILMTTGVVLAQSNQGRTQRPVYLDIVPVADAQYSILSDGVIAAMAREALSAAGQSTILMRGQTLPSGVRVLRILYIVHRQPRNDEVALAASASTQLLRTTDNDGDGVVQTYSIYNGLQQTLVQGPDMDNARTQMREAFKQELQMRIADAFNAAASR